MLFFFLFFFLEVIFFYLIIKFYKKYNLKLLLDNNFKKIQSFHKTQAIKIGGIFLLFNLLIFYILNDHNSFYDKFFLFSLTYFFLGFIVDLNKLEKPLPRFVIMFFITFFIITAYDLNIRSTQITFLDDFLKKNNLLMYLFLTFCILFLVNGSNFIDGFNGLLIIKFIIILSIIFLINYKNPSSNNLNNLCIFLIFSSLVILFFNFPAGKIFLGDSGSYLIGGIISLLLIETSNVNVNIPPFVIACVIFYIFFEVFFSFFRKIIQNKNPFLPDNLHLHMLVFKFLRDKNFTLIKSNYSVSVIINFTYLFLMLPIIFLNNSSNFYKLYFFILIIIYLLSYNILFYLIFAQKKNKTSKKF